MFKLLGTFGWYTTKQPVELALVLNTEVKQFLIPIFNVVSLFFISTTSFSVIIQFPRCHLLKYVKLVQKSTKVVDFEVFLGKKIIFRNYFSK